MRPASASSSPPGPAGARERLSTVLRDHGLDRQADVESLTAALALPRGHVGLAVLPLDAGFETPISRSSRSRTSSATA